MRKEIILSPPPLGNSTSNLSSSKIYALTLLLREEQKNEKSIQLLIDSGIQFDILAEQGIEHHIFAQYFITSGLILNKDIHWFGFHTDHDFAYLLKIFTG